MNITFEERQLMSLYNTGTRTGLIAALEEMRGYHTKRLSKQRSLLGYGSFNAFAGACILSSL